MTTDKNTYRSILLGISQLSSLQLKEVNQYIKKISSKSATEKQANRRKVMALAGGWNDMSDNDFMEYLEVAKETGNSMFKTLYRERFFPNGHF